MKKILQYAMLVLIGVAIMPGCKKFDEVNTNPNNPTSLAQAPSVELTSCELLIGYTFGGDGFRFTGLFDGQCTYNAVTARQFNVYGTYNIPTSNFEASWANVYEAMLNLRDLINVQQPKKDYAYVGISQVLLAYTLGMSTDLWNEMPYSQAFQPLKFLQPVYDQQQNLYDTVQALLTEAVGNLAQTNTQIYVPAGDDIVYQGSTAQWTKLAYALSARFYLHLRKINPSNIAKAQAALANGLASSSDDAFFHFGSSAANASPMYQFLQQRPGEVSFIGTGTGNPPCYADSLMVAISDPRLSFLIDTAANVDWLGSLYSPANAGVVIMSFAEQQFIQAELDFANNNNSLAATDCNNAIATSVQAITGAPAPAAWLSAYGNFTSSTITLQAIIMQKYIALFTNPEVFTDYRRTGFPAVSPLPGALTSIPRRFLYSDTEVNLNKNTPSVQLTDHVWWDQ